MQVEGGVRDLDKLSDSAVVTSRKFVDGSDRTSYDAILIFVEVNGRLDLTRVIESKASGYHHILCQQYPNARRVCVESSASGLGGHTDPKIGKRLDDDVALKELIAEFLEALENAHLRVSATICARFAASLLSKRFVILTGLAGSGKTKLAQAFAHWLTSPSGQSQHAAYVVIPVGADWTGNDNILGYPDGLDTTRYVTRPALDLILRAGQKGNEATPYFLILDEMNLSHVERYFADLLSLIESEETTELYRPTQGVDGKLQLRSGVEPILCLPPNLFIIGTVNVDETTYMFSPKVLDRANVIEFRMDSAELRTFLSNPSKPNWDRFNGQGGAFCKSFVGAAKGSVDVPAEVKPDFDAEMLLFFEILHGHGAEFGYRTAYEAARFMHFYQLLGNYPDGDISWFEGAFDCVVVQKLLPKLHGSRAKLGPVLKKLWFLCVNDTSGRGEDALQAAEVARLSTDKKSEPSVIVPTGAPYPLSAEKIGRMWRLMIENGFTSFAEA